MTDITLDQIEKWKRDSEILDKLEKMTKPIFSSVSLDSQLLGDSWGADPDITCPADINYFIFKERRES